MALQSRDSVRRFVRLLELITYTTTNAKASIPARTRLGGSLRQQAEEGTAACSSTTETRGEGISTRWTGFGDPAPTVEVAEDTDLPPERDAHEQSSFPLSSMREFATLRRFVYDSCAAWHRQRATSRAPSFALVETSGWGGGSGSVAKVTTTRRRKQRWGGGRVTARQGQLNKRTLKDAQ
jgi:hypothetical protein